MGSLRNLLSWLVITVYLIHVLPAGSLRLSFTEGQDALAEYTFPDINPNDVSVEIRKGSIILFDKTGEEHLNAQQADRIKVSKEARGEDTVVRLSITNINREDEGAYLCVVYDSQGTMVLETRSNYISIDFPPGPATCSSVAPSDFSIQNYLGSDETWTVINCLATMGTQSAYIACFNPDLRLPPLYMNINRTHLSGMFWTKKDKPVFCCSATFEIGVDICTCMEYKSHSEEVLCSSNPSTEPLSLQCDDMQTMQSVEKQLQHLSSLVKAILGVLVPTLAVCISTCARTCFFGRKT
ncbi:uncharacterized protein [Diadema setosum]|uniref:uncharacterized protein n=1 Tax=Diadema setosum TaxID=31175 RepID=UPI003B3B4C5F